MSDNDISTIDTLPNELILAILKYLTAREIYRAFFCQNHRFRSIINNISGLYLTITNNECHEPVWLAFSRVVKLTLDDVKQINFDRFSNIRSLTWIRPSDIQLKRLCSFTYFPYLEQLRVYDMHDTPLTSRFHQFIFSNGFTHLRICHLSNVDISLNWTFSSSLRVITISNVTNPHIFERILRSCPNLTRLDLNMFHNIASPTPLSFQQLHLKKLYLNRISSSQSIESMLAMIPTLVQLHIRGKIKEQPSIYFKHLSNTFNNFLANINQFNCDLLFTGRYEDMIRMKPALEQLHSCFKNVFNFTKLSYGRVRIHTK